MRMSAKLEYHCCNGYLYVKDRVMKELMTFFSEHNMIQFYRPRLLRRQRLASTRRCCRRGARAETQKLAEKNEGDVEVHSAERKRAEIISHRHARGSAGGAARDQIKVLTTGKEVGKFLSILLIDVSGVKRRPFV